MSLVAVAPVLAQCTNRCTRRKGAVNAQPTNTEKPKMKKTRHHEEVVKCQNESTRVARLQSEPQGRERRRVGQNWLRMKTKTILIAKRVRIILQKTILRKNTLVGISQVIQNILPNAANLKKITNKLDKNQLSQKFYLR